MIVKNPPSLCRKPILFVCEAAHELRGASEARVRQSLEEAGIDIVILNVSDDPIEFPTPVLHTVETNPEFIFGEAQILRWVAQEAKFRKLPEDSLQRQFSQAERQVHSWPKWKREACGVKE